MVTLPTIRRCRAGQFALLPAAVALLFAGCAPRAAAPGAPTAPATIREGATRPIAILTTNYHGWPGSLLIRSRSAEIVVVPSVGRVMQFRFAGEDDGPFWENRALDGRPPEPHSNEWINFGGDKTWPAPQSDWAKVAQRGWPPPPAFDAMPVETRISGDSIILISPVDPSYGIRTYRRIRLDPAKPVMTITTIYEKVEGPPHQVGIWIITQLKDPAAVFAPIPSPSLFPAGYVRQSEVLSESLKVERGLLSLARDAKSSQKIGMDTTTLLWVGSHTTLRIDSPRVPGIEYPDRGSSAEIYTNPDPLAYVELELLGPLAIPRTGERMQRTATYTLGRRSEGDAETEARRILGR